MNNIFYLSQDDKISQIGKVLNNIKFPYTNGYSLDFGIDNKRKKMIDHIVNLITNEDPIIIIGSSKTTYGACLYSYELSRLLKNKIILVLYGPFLTLDIKNYTDIEDNIHVYGKNHSIFTAFKNLNEDHENIILNKCLRNEMIQKFIFYGENDVVLPLKFTNFIIPSFKNTTSILFKGTNLHNILSLFWYGHSKNFDKLKIVNHYVPEEQLRMCSNIWNTIDYSKLIQIITENNIDKLKSHLDYPFIEINIY